MASSPGAIPGQLCGKVLEDGTVCDKWLNPHNKFCGNCGRPNPVHDKNAKPLSTANYPGSGSMTQSIHHPPSQNPYMYQQSSQKNGAPVGRGQNLLDKGAPYAGSSQSVDQPSNQNTLLSQQGSQKTETPIGRGQTLQDMAKQVTCHQPPEHPIIPPPVVYVGNAEPQVMTSPSETSGARYEDSDVSIVQGQSDVVRARKSLHPQSVGVSLISSGTVNSGQHPTEEQNAGQESSKAVYLEKTEDKPISYRQRKPLPPAVPETNSEGSVSSKETEEGKSMQITSNEAKLDRAKLSGEMMIDGNFSGDKLSNNPTKPSPVKKEIDLENKVEGCGERAGLDRPTSLGHKHDDESAKGLDESSNQGQEAATSTTADDKSGKPDSGNINVNDAFKLKSADKHPLSPEAETLDLEKTPKDAKDDGWVKVDASMDTDSSDSSSDIEEPKPEQERSAGVSDAPKHQSSAEHPSVASSQSPQKGAADHSQNTQKQPASYSQVVQGKNDSKNGTGAGGVAYRKTDKPPEDYVPTRTRSQSQSKVETSKQTSGQCIMVTFQALTSAAFKMTEPKKQGSSVWMAFGCRQLGGWNDPIGPMRPIRAPRDGLVMYEMTVPIPKYLVTLGQSIEYKYVVYRPKKNGYKFEHVPKRYADLANRKLSIHRDYQNIDVWTQYDGVMHKKLKSKFNPTTWVKSSPDARKEAVKAAQYMLPEWQHFLDPTEDHCAPAEELLEEIDRVLLCVKERLIYEGTERGELKQVIVPYLGHLMRRVDETCQSHGTETAQEGVLRLARAIVVSHLIVKYDLYDSVDRSSAKALCYAFLIKPDLTDFKGIDEHFTKQNDKSEISIMIKNLIERGLCCSSFCEPMWVLIIPLYHLLRGIQNQKTKNYKTSNLWWGTAGIHDVVKKFQEQYNLPREHHITEYQRCFEPLFKKDPVLPRTMMAIVTYKKMETDNMTCFTAEAILANMLYALNNNYPSGSDYEQLPGKLGIIIFLLMQRRTLIAQATEAEELLAEIEQAKLQTEISVELLSKLALKVAQPRHFLQYTTMICALLECLHNQILAFTKLRTISESSIGKDEDNEITAIICKVQEVTDRWLRFVLPTYCLSPVSTSSVYFSSAYEMDIFSTLLSMDIDEKLTESWTSGILAFLRQRYERLTPMDKMELYCYGDFTKYHNHIGKFFSDMAFDAVDDLCKQRGDCRKLFREFGTENSHKIKGILARLFERMWPTDSHNDNILNLVLTWPAFVRYLVLFCGEEQSASLLSKDLEEKIQIALSVFTDTVNRLIEGDIDVKTVKLLVKNRENLLAVQKAIDSTSKDEPKVPENLTGINMSQMLLKVLNWREREWEQFEVLKQKIAGFVEMCRRIKPVTIEALEEKLDTPVELLKVSALCKPQHFTAETAKMPSYNPNYIYFGLDDAVKGCIENFSLYKGNNTFISLWDKMAKSAHKRLGEGKPLELAVVVTDIWDAACQMFHKLLKGVEAGTISFREINEHFHEYKDKYSDLKEELTAMAMITKDRGNGHWINDRVKQVEHYHTLHRYSRGAKVMLKMKKKFRLTGDFSVLENILGSGTNKDKPLNSMNEELVKAGQALTGLDREKQDCLTTFLDNKELVDWLRLSLEGPGQVKVLVDLAMITASGQGDLEVKKVKMLHAATIGYAPLIYELDQDANFPQFLDCCRSVWRALDADPKLPTKLRDIGRHLEWLKKVKDSKGSMELNAFAQAEKINTKGIYKIGNIKVNHPKSVDEALELIIPAMEGEEEPQTYTYVQLNDLQSKLMLVAGKAQEGKEEVDRFVEIFDGVTRLASLYIKLCNAGSILFKNWSCNFHCDKTRKVNADIDFGLADHVLRGQNSATVDVTNQIFNVCDFLEDCLKDWIHHIEVKRTEFHSLNYFTTEQLVTLRKELATISRQERCEAQNTILAMLSVIEPDCQMKHLQDALSTALVYIKSLRETHQRRDFDMEDDRESSSESGSNGESQAEKEEFLATLQDSNIPLKLAQKGLQEFGSGRLQEAMMWCMEKMADDDSIESDDTSSHGDMDSTGMQESPASGSSDNMAFGNQTTLEELTTGLLKQLHGGQSTLISKLKELWDGYLETVSTSVSDYLSIEHLGHFLTQLAHRENRSVDRPFPEYLKAGQPNLIVCPNAELLQTVLALYMHRGGQEKPLPQRNEVLLCSQDTSPEQVELLLRMASNDENQTFYCLADVGCLDYEVAQKAEGYFDKYTKTIENLRLVVLCSRETEDRSHIVTFLEQFRIPYTALYKLQQVQHYLEKHFKVDTQDTAPILDPDQCSVRLVKSHRAGVGKTLKVHRLREKLQNPVGRRKRDAASACVTIPLQKKHVNISTIVERLSVYMPDTDRHISRIFHIDLASEVQEGVDHFLFNLLVLGSVMDVDGTVWQRSNQDLYLVETMPLLQAEFDRQGNPEGAISYVHSVLHLLPSLTCWSPVECLLTIQGNTQAMQQRYPDWQKNDRDQLMDDGQFQSEAFQRAYQYLAMYAQGGNLKDVNAHNVRGNHVDCLKTLIKFCGIQEPSWAELSHFVHFLNIQLRDCELSDFCNPHVEQDIPNFRQFVVKFMISMSRDFATRSLNISEETPLMKAAQMEVDGDEGEDLVQYIIKRRWETSPHPYIFFNADPLNEARHSMTFLGFNVGPTGDIIDPQSNIVLDRNVLAKNLQDALQRNRVQLNENFDNLPRLQKIERICLVVGMDMPYDPDPSYELTTDNVKKILAIHMRFRCQIPVVVMGETGCGKTRLVKFMCDLQKPPGVNNKNLILMKVHGGTTDEEIMRKVEKAGQLAFANRKDFPRMDTVLFFDEANTTDAIGLIKEIMCDRTMRGQPLPEIHGLKFVVACNPYRKHSAEVIKGLEQAGLGYHVQADATKDRLGRIPMRQLVYRVHALPQSMLPLVWDFGQLNERIEELYIRQMVLRAINERYLPNIPGLKEVMSSILSASQEFMKQQKDECSFVSLRDVDRVIKVMAWFFQHREPLFDLMDDKARRDQNIEALQSDEEDEEPPAPDVILEDTTRALVLAIGVCYHACLQKRAEYRRHISPKFTQPLLLPDGPQTIADEINRCQEVFLDQIQLGDNIAKNQALKENLFMMVICIELRIPLFLVGKPGSSKSLAKTIVADAMQGDAAHHKLFRDLKLVHMISFQCSPLSRPDGIVGTFHQCAQLQEDKDLGKFVAVVVLDEVGLAEDSPLMPLKTLHPLLEDGCQGDEEPEPHKKVACIAISNWALDPAKMNRGIHVQRGVPDIQELEDSAKGICSTTKIVQNQIATLFKPLADGYLKLYDRAVKEKREFFGLRDFYSLVKMVYGFSARSKKKPTWFELQHAILRNFGGLDKIDPVDVFSTTIHDVDKRADRRPEDPDCSPSAMIEASLSGDGLTSESRYLLILTENYAALGILQQELLNDDKTTVIFGSSFPKDQEYTQVCRNINKIKVCMEAGRTVVLLNLENLYESLYDALNQYYVKLGGDRFVDLGLGTQRVKCEVHQDFKLVVVAEKQVVYEKFPIPLINRLEKHFLAMANMLSEAQIKIVQQLQKWTNQFANVGTLNMQRAARVRGPRIEDVFIGYNVDTAASVTMQVCQKLMGGRKEGDDEWAQNVFERAQDLLLQCATPDAVVRLKGTEQAFYERYFHHQKHDNLGELLLQEVRRKDHRDGLFLQVSTHSKLLSNYDAAFIMKSLELSKDAIKLVALQAFDTEHQFTKMLRDFFGNAKGKERLLLLQCDSGNECSDLIACARYIIQDEYNQTDRGDAPIHVVLVIQLPRIGRGSFVGFQGGRWLSYHIDDLHLEKDQLPSLQVLKERSVSNLFAGALRNLQLEEAMEATEDIDPEAEVEDLPMETEEISERWVKLPKEEHMEGVDEVNVLDVEDIKFEEEPRPGPSSRRLEAELGRAQEVAPCGMDGGDFYGLRNIGASMKRDVQHLTESSRLLLEGGGEQLDINRLMEKCIHGAAAMVKDYEQDADRKTKRVEILLNLLDKNNARETDESKGALDFMDVINYRICQLLKDKEELAMNLDMANNWLCNEAASVEAVNKAGTFRRALWQYLEAKITPLLAGLIAYADRNRNMDLLKNHNRNSWIHKFWLQMLMHREITELTYNDLQTVLHRTELSEFQVETSGCDKTLFSAVLPYSWVFYNKIEELIFNAKGSKSQEDVESLVNRLLEKEAPKVIRTFTSETCQTEFVEMYLEDFMHMVYKPQSNSQDVEHELVKKCIRQAASETHLQNRSTCTEPLPDEGPPPDLELTLPAIHLTHSQIKPRIHLCSQVFQVWPNVIDKLLESAEKESGHNPEMILDIQLLHLMLVDLAPDSKKFDKDLACRNIWMEKVDRFRPVIERILTSAEEKNGQNSDRYQNYLKDSRHLWTKVNVVFLFLQHVCPPNIALEGKKTNLYSCMALWNFFKQGDTNFKDGKALSIVEKFLMTCNKMASTLYFKTHKTCKCCEETMNNPVSLPCRHVVCGLCVLQMKDLNNRKCPECNKEFPPDFKPKLLEGKREEIAAHNKYKQCCNAFFMDLVSRLCFHGTTPPDAAVIKKLMGYVTCEYRLTEKDTRHRTRDMTVFRDTIDPTPVVRSFLLQLLLRSEIDDIRDHLDDYFKRARGLFQTKPQEILELCILCVHCLEDHHYSQLSKIANPAGRVAYIRNLMREYTGPLNTQELDIVHIETVAGMRFALAEVAEYLYSVNIKNDRKGAPPMKLQELFKVASIVCNQGTKVKGLTPTGLYLMRQIHKRFGRNALEQIGDVPELRWVIPASARNVEGGVKPDRYVILGDVYKTSRDQLAEVMMGEDPKGLLETFKNQRCSVAEKERNMLLAVHREVSSVLVKPQQHQLAPEILVSISNFCQKDLHMKQQDILQGLLTNKLGGACRQLNLTANQSAQEEELAELLLHCWIVLGMLEKNKLPDPLIGLMLDTPAMMQSYLPSMPEDHLEEVRAALLEGRRGGHENPVMYQCPNGHPYVIGDCGRPVVGAQCKTCGATIGGHGYNLHQGNVKLGDTLPNRTSPGHILGRATQRGDVPVPERLSPASTCSLRMLVHMAMVLGANRDPQTASRLLRQPGNISPAETPQFLWEHLEVDLKLLGKALGKSPEEAAIFMHILLDRMLTRPQTPGLGRVDRRLGSLESRREWERKFAEEYIAPVLKTAEETIQASNNQLANDSRLADNRLMKALYEVEQPSAAPNIKEILNEPAMWRSRSRITIEHLNQQFQESTGRTVQTKTRKNRPGPKHEILDLFLQEAHRTQALRHLPGIIKLQRLLSQKFHRNIDSAEATKLQIRDLMAEHVENHLRDEYRDLIHNFAEAWELLKEKLGTFAAGGSTVPAEYCEQVVNDDTSLAMLLPTSRGQGLCATAIVHYMVQVHNDLVENYARVTRQKLAAERSVSVQEVTQAHLVSYHPDRDLMPIILANCNYSLTAGQSTTIEYDYGGMEQQITERFIRGRSRIIPEVYPIVFREDFTNNAVFTQLKSKIQQEPSLTANLQQQIRRELRYLTELNDGLATLDIAIGFLVSVGGDRDIPLLEFIETTLRMTSGALRGVAQVCRLKHTQALWLLLSHERAKLLALGDQDAFDQVEDKYREDMPGDLAAALITCFQHLNNLDLLTGYLFEYIVLKLTVRQDTNAEDYVDDIDHPLHYVLGEYIEERGYHEIQALANDAFPKAALVKHSAATWRLALRILHGN